MKPYTEQQLPVNDTGDLTPRLTEWNIFYDGMHRTASVVEEGGDVFMDWELDSFAAEACSVHAAEETQETKSYRMQRQLVALTMVLGRRLDSISQQLIGLQDSEKGQLQAINTALRNLPGAIDQLCKETVAELETGNNMVLDTLEELPAAIKKTATGIQESTKCTNAILANQREGQEMIAESVKEMQIAITNSLKDLREDMRTMMNRQASDYLDFKLEMIDGRVSLEDVATNLVLEASRASKTASAMIYEDLRWIVLTALQWKIIVTAVVVMVAFLSALIQLNDERLARLGRA